jgi:hypothetical protein
LPARIDGSGKKRWFIDGSEILRFFIKCSP